MNFLIMNRISKSNHNSTSKNVHKQTTIVIQMTKHTDTGEKRMAKESPIVSGQGTQNTEGPVLELLLVDPLS